MRTRQSIAYYVAVAVGTLYVVVQYWLYDPTGPFSLTRRFVVSFCVMLAASVPLGRLAKPKWPILLLVFAGICGGVILNSAYDFAINQKDHNLFPIEIVFLAVFGMPGVVVGLALSWLWRDK